MVFCSHWAVLCLDSTQIYNRLPEQRVYEVLRGMRADYVVIAYGPCDIRCPEGQVGAAGGSGRVVTVSRRRPTLTRAPVCIPCSQWTTWRAPMMGRDMWWPRGSQTWSSFVSQRAHKS